MSKQVKEKRFKAKYNVVAACIMFNRALERGDLKSAKEVAQICIEAQEKE